MAKKAEPVSRVFSVGGDEPTPRARARGASRAAQLVKVAERMFYERGYSDTSMDDLALAVGIQKGSLYYYVKGKDDLLFRIAENVHKAVNELFDAAAAREDLTPLGRIVEYVESQLTHNANNIVELAVYHHDWKRLEGKRLATVVNLRDAFRARVIAMLQEAKDAGEIKESVDLRLASAHLFAVNIWPYTWYRTRGSISAEELARSGGEFVRSGLAGMS